MELMAGVDSWIEMPKRDVDLDFLMPIEDVFTITGRGTVATESNQELLTPVILLILLVWVLKNFLQLLQV